MAPPAADLLIVFRGTAATKQQATGAESECSQLVGTLRNGGLHVFGVKLSLMAKIKETETLSTAYLRFGFSDDELQGIKNQFGVQIAMYFAFVSFYAKSLLVPAALDTTFWYLHEPFSPYYSLRLSVWSVIFVVWWCLKKRVIAFQGTNNSTDSQPDDSEFPWYKRESRIVASFPTILAFATALTGLLTSIFIVEAFVTHLYTGPPVKSVSLAPTAMLLLFVPRLVGFYQKYAISLTGWGNHVHESERERSLALKTFALSSIVAYGGLYLSAFVYIPFGELIIQLVQTTFFTSPTAHSDRTVDQKVAAVKDASKMLNPDRLKNQVYAYLITNQVIGEFLELGVPAIARLTQKARGQVVETEAGKKSLKKVGWEDEKKADDLANAAITEEEKALVRHARKQVALPEYDVFGDYSEMITQFGYYVLWSACWSLAPIGALVNNWMELRGDAIKIATYGRRPIPRRTDTIGPWLDILILQAHQFSTRLPLLPRDDQPGTFDLNGGGLALPLSASFMPTVRNAVLPAVLIAMTSSHVYLLARALVKHVLMRVVWRNSPDAVKLAWNEKDVKRKWLKEVGGAANVRGQGVKIKSLDPAASGVSTGLGAGDVPKSF